MNRRPHLTLVALIVAGLIGVGLLAIPGSPIHQKPTLGLDLQGGLEVTLQAVPPPNRKLQKSDLTRSVEILRDRIDRLGVAEPEIREQGDDQISIQIPGIENTTEVIGILGQTAQLELYDLEANLVPPSIGVERFPVATESLYALLAGQQSLADEKTTGVLVPLRRPEEEARRPGGQEGRAAQEQGRRGGRRGGQAAEGLEDLRRAAEDGRAHVRHRRDRLPGRRRREPDPELLLPDPQRRVQELGRQRDDGAGDARRRPQALRDAPGLRHDDRASRS